MQRSYERVLFELVKEDPEDLLRYHKLLDAHPDVAERGTAQWLAIEYSVLRDRINGRADRTDDELYESADQIEQWTDGILARFRHADRLAELRGMPYREYLRTSEWRARRLVALERAEHRCQVCNTPERLDVHHRTYEHIGEERDEDLLVLCRGCHGLFHEHRNLAE